MKKIFPERFKGQVIVLTGAARGIGKATALRAAREGARLVLTDRLDVNLHAEHKTVKRSEKKGRNVERLNISGFMV